MLQCNMFLTADNLVISFKHLNSELFWSCLNFLRFVSHPILQTRCRTLRRYCQYLCMWLQIL